VIAAVVVPRPHGSAVAEARLRSLGGLAQATPLEVRATEHGVVARFASGAAQERFDETTLAEPRSVDEALAASGGGASIGFERGDGAALVLQRGSFGGRPLYHAVLRDGARAVCSELRPLAVALQAEADRPLVPDADRLALLSTGLSGPELERTAYAAIRRVAPCGVVRLAAGAAEPSARVRPLRHVDEARSVDVEELAAELWTRLVASVTRAVGPARRVAVMVGGGIDSSGLLAATVAVARGASPAEAGEVVALSLDFDARGSDRPYRRDLARHLGIVPLCVSPSEAGPWFLPSLVLDAQPHILAAGPMEQLLARRARDRGVEVILSGYLADEILAGDLRGLATEARQGHLVRAALRAARLRLPWPTTARERIAGFVVKPLLKPLLPRRLLTRGAVRAHERAFPWAGERMRRALASVRAWATSAAPPVTASDRFARFERWPLYADYADMRGQMESSTGIVRRDPFADEGILELVASVPPHVVCHGNLHRGLFRVALRGRVPETIRFRVDKAWFEPALAAAAEAGGGLAALGDLWRPRALEALGIVEAEAFAAAMQPLLDDPASSDDSAFLWGTGMQVVACEAFLRGLEGSRAVAP